MHIHQIDTKRTAENNILARSMTYMCVSVVSYHIRGARYDTNPIISLNMVNDIANMTNIDKSKLMILAS